MTEVKKSITINVPTQLVDKETHKGKEYVKASTGETKTPVLRGVTLNLGTADEPKWGKISVREGTIIPMTNFNTKAEIAGMSTVFLEPDVDYTFTTREKTGKQIEDKDGKMVNEWVNKTEKISGTAIKEAMKASRNEYVHSAKEAGEKDSKTLWVSIPASLVSEKGFAGKPYTTKQGEEKTPTLHAVSLNLGTADEPKWGTLAVREEAIVDAKNFKTNEKIDGIKRFPLDPTVDYTFTTREKTGKQIEDKDGKMVNEWVNKTEKISGADIAGALKAGREAYKHSINDLESKKAEVAAPTAEAPKKAIEDLDK